MICFKCKKKIREKENYFTFNEYSEGKWVNTDFCHKVCWDKFKKSVASVSDYKELLRRLESSAVEKGLIKSKEVVVEC